MVCEVVGFVFGVLEAVLDIVVDGGLSAESIVAVGCVAIGVFSLFALELAVGIVGICGSDATGVCVGEVVEGIVGVGCFVEQGA